MKSKLIKYGITALIGLLLAVFVLNNYGFFEMSEADDRYKCLCDAFTIPGVVLIMCGALVWISQQGMFDSLSYAGKMIVDQFRINSEHLKYGDYVMEKRENRKEGGFGFLIITGAVFTAISLIFLALYHM